MKISVQALVFRQFSLFVETPEEYVLILKALRHLNNDAADEMVRDILNATERVNHE
jgi:hypothetical protein